MWEVLFLLFFLTLLGSLISLFFRTVRRKAKWLALASCGGLVVSVFIGVIHDDKHARQMGYLSATDLREASEAGVTDLATWQALQKKARAVELAAVAKRAELLRPPANKSVS